jgi:ferredoxin-NADP reductase
MYVTLDHAEQITATLYTFWFKTPRPMRFTAGQFIELYLPHEQPDNRGTKHWFTLSSSPTEDQIGITTAFAAGQSSTFKQKLRALTPGTEVMISEPMGDFVLPKDPGIPLVFIAAGIGITPVRSITKWLTDTNQQRAATCIYGVRHPDDLAFTALLEAYYKDRFIPLVSSPRDAWQGHAGHITAENIIALGNTPAQSLYYLSGPEVLVEGLTKDLHTRGIAKHHIITDYFLGYPASS